ncbi:MAG: hypothetical protein LUI87_08695 [Lachnospiraceae bacterium]|nr:hypothetical protein [Lachnospiraceae bacterium]
MLYALYNAIAAEQNKEINPVFELSKFGECSEPLFNFDISSLPVDLFRFTIERNRHVQGEWRSVIATLFPGYFFFECDKDMVSEVRARLDEELNKGQRIKQQLPLISIPQELSDLLYELCDQQHHISMSKGIIVNGMAHVTEGPLMGYDNRIVRIDRHKRLAWLKYSENITRDFSKNSTSTLVAGLEITERVS